MPSMLSLTQAKKSDFVINPLLLEHGYLITIKENAAVMKGWANIARPFQDVPGVLLHCIEYNLGFKLAVPRHCLSLFQRPKDPYTLAEILVVGVPFRPGFLEPRLNDAYGLEALCVQYLWGVTGATGVQKFLEGPSYVTANLEHVAILAATDGKGNEFVAEALMMEEEKVLVGFIPGTDRRESWSLLPTVYIIRRFLKGEAHGWTSSAEGVMNKRWNEVIQGVAFALTMDEWESYLGEFQGGTSSADAYAYDSNDSQYGVDLFNIAYLVSWTIIKLDAIIIPEVFRGYNIVSEDE
ncbi:hypothetical protein EDD18DRAFT_1358160 [Armillaria luteobubalina]|uniref:Uncharacterized protein n=1 Tax=Armillaria luteobubalina TaxID=153913 RepID=A0AA39UKV9_9AGAR|nr:hypothetical protein EDD18DRAFT_1358160 [Armillaria luteobubalina]